MKNKFSQLTAAQKRVAIAKDVLLQIKAKKYLTGNGYLYVVRGEHVTKLSKDNLSSIKACHVCAIGAAAVSCIRKFNKHSIDLRLSGSDRLMPTLLDWFSREQIELIEGCFEGHSLVSGDYFRRYKTRKNRMVAIFKNIIANNGTFKP